MRGGRRGDEREIKSGEALKVGDVGEEERMVVLVGGMDSWKLTGLFWVSMDAVDLVMRLGLQWTISPNRSRCYSLNDGGNT